MRKYSILLLVVMFLVVSSQVVRASWLVEGDGALSYIAGYVLGKDDNNGKSPIKSSDSEVEDDDFTSQGQAKINVINAGKEKSLIIRSQNNSLKLSVLDEDGEEEEIDQESSESGELELEDPPEKNKVKVKALENAALVIRNKVAAKTNFPLMVNLETNELIVTTPKGSKVVTVLPDAAVANMLAANVLDQLGGKGGLLWEEYQARIAEEEEENEATESGEVEDSTPSASQEPGEEGSESAEVSPSPSPESEEPPADEFVELVVDEEGDLVYAIEGFKEEKFFGVFKVNLKRKVYVSAETGELVKIEQDLRTRIIDALSF